MSINIIICILHINRCNEKYIYSCGQIIFLFNQTTNLSNSFITKLLPLFRLIQCTIKKVLVDKIGKVGDSLRCLLHNRKIEVPKCTRIQSVYVHTMIPRIRNSISQWLRRMSETLLIINMVLNNYKVIKINTLILLSFTVVTLVHKSKI